MAREQLLTQRSFMKHLFLIIAAALAVAVQTIAAPIGTAFTYQGHLTDRGRPATDVYDFQFTLHVDPVTNRPLPIAVQKNDVPLTNGLFTVELDFAWVSHAHARYLQIEVRAGDSTGAYPP